MTRYENGLFDGYDRYDYVYVYVTYDGIYYVVDTELTDTYDEASDTFDILEDYGYVGDLLDGTSEIESYSDDE